MNYIVYLGKRGGGALLLNSILSEMPENERENWVVVKSIHNETTNSFGVTIRDIHTPTNLFSAFKYFRTMASFLISLTDRLRDKDDIFIFLQNSPWDFPALIVCKILKFKITVAIHDWKRHLGDVWPPAFMTNFLLAIANQFIVFSSHAAVELNLKGNVLQLRLPGNRNPSMRCKDPDNESITFSCIGRIRTYKGLEVFNKAVELNDTPNHVYKIIGSGKLRTKLSPRIILTNRWLDEKELEEEIFNSDAIVLPYLEASQSGLIPLAISMQKFILVSDVPSLVDQIKSYNYSEYLIHAIGDAVMLSQQFNKVIITKKKVGIEYDANPGQFETGFWEAFSMRS